jgi:hypothetical protein
MQKSRLVLNGIVGIVGVIGAVASIQGAWGNVWLIVFGLLLLAAAFFFGRSLAPLFTSHPWSGTLLQAIDDVGLLDIAVRDNETTAVPPLGFIKSAGHEVVITGVTAMRTLDQHRQTLVQLLNGGRHVYLAILHPRSPSLDQITKNEAVPVREHINASLMTVKKLGLHEHLGFHLRFFMEMPPFTGIMIDGDVAHTGESPSDSAGQLRVQPRTLHASQQHGIILHFRKQSQGRKKGGFDFFAGDLRRQWRLDAKEDLSVMAGV